MTPNNRAADALENCGVLGVVFGAVAVVGVFLGLLDVGRWTSVVTWAMVIAGGLLVLGVVLFDVGSRWNRRHYERWSVLSGRENT